MIVDELSQLQKKCKRQNLTSESDDPKYLRKVVLYRRCTSTWVPRPVTRNFLSQPVHLRIGRQKHRHVTSPADFFTGTTLPTRLLLACPGASLPINKAMTPASVLNGLAWNKCSPQGRSRGGPSCGTTAIELFGPTESTSGLLSDQK